MASAHSAYLCAGKGGKNRRRGKNENEEKRELKFKEEGQGMIHNDYIYISKDVILPKFSRLKCSYNAFMARHCTNYTLLFFYNVVC